MCDKSGQNWDVTGTSLENHRKITGKMGNLRTQWRFIAGNIIYKLGIVHCHGVPAGSSRIIKANWFLFSWTIKSVAHGYPLVNIHSLLLKMAQSKQWIYPWIDGDLPIVILVYWRLNGGSTIHSARFVRSDSAAFRRDLAMAEKSPKLGIWIWTYPAW